MTTPQADPGLHTSVSPADRPEVGSQPVPVRLIMTVIGLVLATAAALFVVIETQQVLTWMLVAAFFAVALNPVVGWVQRRAFGDRRALATLVIFLAVLLALAGIIAVFVVPLAAQGRDLAGQLPTLLQDARSGRGAVGELLERTNALEYVQDNQERIRSFVTGLTTPAAGLLRDIATGVAGTVTVFVLAYLMVLEGPRMTDGALSLFQPRTATRIRRVAADCARSITGYISGNLVISIVCGVLTYAVLRIVGVPFAGLIAMFVAIVDLIPLVGATLGAVVAGVAGLVHSVPAGVVIIVFFVAYQQLENHLLQPVIYSRTVQLNPLTVIVAILVGVELAGILGALLAIPMASMVQVIATDLWNERRGHPKRKATVHEGRQPAETDLVVR